MARRATPSSLAVEPEFQRSGLCASFLSTPGSDATCYRTWELPLVRIWCLFHCRQGGEVLIWKKTPSTSGVQLKILFLFLTNKQKRAKKRILGITELKCAFLRFGGPPLNSWDILDLEITHLYQGLLSFTS